MRNFCGFTFASFFLSAILIEGVAAQSIEVVNMIPATLSPETEQDSEPDLTVSPLDPELIVASAFTPNPSGATATAPIYISQDGGNTWWLNNIVPSGNGMTGDITVALSRNDVLYAGILRGGSTDLDMRILRSGSYMMAGAMTQLMGRTDEDQPYTRVYAPMGGAQRNNDHVYVGHNDFNNLPQSASLEQSLDAETAAPPAGLGVLRLERRTPSGQDGPPIRQAIHADGTVYVAYTQRTASSGNVRTGNIVVVKDEDWGQGTTPYGDLTDPSDTQPGRFVVSGVDWIWDGTDSFGQARLGDRLSIAVDPTDSDTVYVAWATRSGTTGITPELHVRRSSDGGQNWAFCSVTQTQTCSTDADCPPTESCLADLRTITGGISPQLAVNVRGDVGFLYQQLTGTSPNQRWETHFQQSTDGGANWADFTLSDTPADTPTVDFYPYLGDYAGLTAVGKDFFGVFSANNTPDNANFPNGVTYQRSANFTTNTLDDGSGTSVSASIDPFFFRAENLERDQDYYVRDWTDSSTDNDLGLEPSTDPWFFNTSDVWNRRSNGSGGFNANDQPISQNPQPATFGDNWAFARVHRKDDGSAETVTLHFLKSEFGTGSNYQDAGTGADPTLSFGAADLVQTMSSGYQWPLTATTSSHTCLAVEISTSSDPTLTPSLLGRAPGWPDTDLLVLYDNNKAQRNMGVHTLSDSGAGNLTAWAVVHNAANWTRDVILHVVPDSRFERLFKTPRLIAVGDLEQGSYQYEGGLLTLPSMAPGENRWVALTVPGEGKLETPVTVTFSEVVGEVAVSGFTLAFRAAPFEVAAAQSLTTLGSNLVRLGHFVESDGAIERLSKFWLRGDEGKISRQEYEELLSAIQDTYQSGIKAVLSQALPLAFNIEAKSDAVREALVSGDQELMLAAHSDLDRVLDASLTYLAKRQGDVADVAQNMRWQAFLLHTKKSLLDLGGLEDLAELSTRFDVGYATRGLSINDYSPFVERSLPDLERINRELNMKADEFLEGIAKSLRDPARLQAAHRDFLLKLEGLP
jgi:hypothetical protein